MWSYVYSLKKTRLLLDEQKQHPLRNDLKNVVLKPVRSLYFYLLDNVATEINSIADPLQRALTQALRIAGSVNDYKLILQLVSAVNEYCIGDGVQYAIVDPRVLGEAVSALGKTTANTNKIGRVWRTSAHYRCWSRPIGAREINALLQVLSDRRKIKSMLNLYHESCASSAQQPSIDPYSISIVLQGLRKSVAAEPKQLIPKSNITQAPLRQWFLKGLIDPLSPCWQWEEAIRVVDASFARVNNPVISALLQLNSAVARSHSRHDGPQMAKRLHHILTTRTFMQLDAVTCTIILQSLGSQHEAALKILGSYEAKPTTRMVGAAAAVCLRSRQYPLALQMVEDQLASRQGRVDPRVYRALLRALLHPTTGKRRTRRDRKDAMVRMQCALKITSLLLLPHSSDDEVASTCRSFLAVLADVQGLLKPIDWQSLNTLADCDAENTALLFQHAPANESVSQSSADFLVHCTLGVLAGRGLEACPMTLQHAASSMDSTSVLPFLRTTLVNLHADTLKATLRMLAQRKDASEYVLELVAIMQQRQHPWDSECLLSLVHGLGRHEGLAPRLADLLLGHSVESIVVPSGVDFSLAFHPLLIGESHFASGVCSCLLLSDFVGARKLLIRLHEEPQVSQDSMQKLAFAFATKALDGSSHKRTQAAKSRALTAYQMQKSIREPSVSLLVIVARASYYCGLVSEARGLLQQLHSMITEPQPNSSSKRRDEHIRALASLHQDMLRHSAKTGDLVEALATYSSVEELSDKVLGLPVPNAIEEAAALSVGPFELKLLLKAAAKAGDWKACLRTFQSIRPFVEATHVDRLGEDDDTSGLDVDYGRLEDVMTETTKCLSRTRQYAWVLRVLNDWIAWGGRRPPVAAMRNAIRMLASKSRGRELCAIVLQCASMESSKTISDDTSYLPVLFSSAVTALYKNGMFDLADDMFLSGVTHGAIPLSYVTSTDGGLYRNTTIDLHGFNLAMAHSAVRVSLQQEALELSESNKGTRVTIVTGRGLRSALRLRPILRPAVQQMLVEEFYPPLGSSTVPWNTGALEIDPTDVAAWTENQKWQKGTRMLIVAAMLKNVARPLSVAISRAIEPQ